MQGWFRFVLCCLVAVTALGSTTITASAQDFQPIRPTAVEPDLEFPERKAPGPETLYLVRLADPPIAAYRGGTAGLAPTSPEATGEGKLLAGSSAVLAYRTFLESRHAEFLNSVYHMLGRAPVIAHRYFAANNGMAVRLLPEEAERVSRLPQVAFLQADFTRQLHTDAGPSWIGADSIWDGSGTGGLGSTQGEGIVIGVIDSGINPSNPSFAAVGPVDGYVHINPNGSGTFVPGSYCATVPSLCNDKLIGLWNFTTDSDPVDNDGHGSHTASTAAGNLLPATLLGAGASDIRTISGVARHANIIAYKACVSGGCPVSSLTSAIDRAILDGVDVINYSIGSSVPSDVWNDFDTVGFLNARSAGVFVATSAGNSGPGARTVGSPADAPWLTSVAASSHDRVYWNVLQSMSGGGAPPPADIVGKGFTGGLPATPIVHAKNFGDDLCLNPFPAGTFSGQIVVCNRGSIARVAKGQNVLDGGAGGYILANQPGDGESLSLDPHVLPASHIGNSDAQVLEAWLDVGTGHMAALSGATLDIDPLNGDVMASFSSRGPNGALAEIIKPDVSAPGVDIAAAYGIADPSPAEWSFLSGTSMSSPHVAGSGALLKALHPTWTPAEIQSALMTTAQPPLVKEDLTTPTDPFDVGSGRVDLPNAVQVGLVMNESQADYLAADPVTGGDPSSLNLASLGNGSCLGVCTWTREVRSTLASAMNWTVSVTNPPGIELIVSPNAFSLPSTGSQALTVTASLLDLAPPDTWRFGSVHLSPTSGPIVRLPVALANDNPGGLPTTYAVSTSATNPLCKVPYGDGSYLNLQDFSIFPASTLFGNEFTWSAFSTGSPFSYYGSSYTGWRGSDNGFGFFDVASFGGSPAIPQTLPDPALPNTLQAPLWSDLEIVYDAGTNRGVSLATLGDASDPTSWAIVEYDDPVPTGGGSSVGDFQNWVRRTPDDAPGAPDIVFAYDNLGTLPALATIGVENFGGTAGAALLNPGNPASALSNDFKVCFDNILDYSQCSEELIVTDHEVAGPESFLAQSSITAGAGFTVLPGGQAHLLTDAGGRIVFYNGTEIQGEMAAGSQPGICPP